MVARFFSLTSTWHHSPADPGCAEVLQYQCPVPWRPCAAANQILWECGSCEGAVPHLLSPEWAGELDVSIVHQPAQIHICMLEVIKDWSWECPGNEATYSVFGFHNHVHVEFAFNNLMCNYSLSYKYMYGLQYCAWTHMTLVPPHITLHWDHMISHDFMQCHLTSHSLTLEWQ